MFLYFDIWLVRKLPFTAQIAMNGFKQNIVTKQVHKSRFCDTYMYNRGTNNDSTRTYRLILIRQPSTIRPQANASFVYLFLLVLSLLKLCLKTNYFLNLFFFVIQLFCIRFFIHFQHIYNYIYIYLITTFLLVGQYIPQKLYVFWLSLVVLNELFIPGNGH